MFDLCVWTNEIKELLIVSNKIGGVQLLVPTSLSDIRLVLFISRIALRCNQGWTRSLSV